MSDLCRSGIEDSPACGSRHLKRNFAQAQEVAGGTSRHGVMGLQFCVEGFES